MIFVLIAPSCIILLSLAILLVAISHLLHVWIAAPAFSLLQVVGITALVGLVKTTLSLAIGRYISMVKGSRWGKTFLSQMLVYFVTLFFV